MKKLLLSVGLVAGAFGAQAQLANGAAAPDFTVTDIDGQSHSLATYMAAGKTVVMDLSATWCGPCWWFHSNHVLEQIYQTYGPNASDEVVVIFVEGDSQTTDADLHGTGTNTQGDWTDGTSYPIIDGTDGSTLANDYQVAGWPTLYSICPDGGGASTGTVYNFEFSAEFNTPDVLAKINECNAVTGIATNIHAKNTEVGLCSAGATDVTVSFESYGTDAVTAANFSLKEDGSEISTQSFSGNVATYATGDVTFSGITIDPSKAYTVEVVDVNGGANNELSVADISVNEATLTSEVITVKFFTDNYPSETRWELIDENGTVVAQEGPYQPGTEDAAGAGGPDALTTKEMAVTLPAGDHCYSVKLIDSYGDGQQYGTGENNGGFGLAIVNSWNEEVFNWDGGSGWSDTEKSAAVRTDATSSIDENGIANVFSVYPNPANDQLNVAFNGGEGNFNVSLMDVSGRVLLTQKFTAQPGAQNLNMNVSDFTNGNYVLTISSTETTYTQKVVIK